MKLIFVVVLSVFLFQENHPPVVKLTVPAAATTNSPVSYSINVSDKEDGETKFDEINPNEILLQVQYGNDGRKNDVSAVHAMMASNCMNCHAFKSRLIGPSYLDISKKYSSMDAAILVKHVKEGSKGVWGDIVMPTHPELPEEAISKMVKWILKYKDEKQAEYYLGKDGSFQLQKTGTVIFIASYLDHSKTLGEDRLSIQVK
jgi:cytochrome c